MVVRTGSRRVLARGRKVFVGVEVQKNGSHVTAGVEGGVVFRARTLPVYRALKQILERFRGCEVCVAYEAGPCGFGPYTSWRGTSTAARWPLHRSSP